MNADDAAALAAARQTLREQIAYLIDPAYWTPGQYTAEVDEFVDALVAVALRVHEHNQGCADCAEVYQRGYSGAMVAAAL